MSSGLYYDRDAIDFLAREIHEGDSAEAGASSHWREMHATFRYSEGRLTGLRGFGTHTPRSRWVESFAHRVLQGRWRRLGRAFAGYPRIERTAREVAHRQGRVVDLDVLRQALTLPTSRRKFRRRWRRARRSSSSATATGRSRPSRSARSRTCASSR